MDRVLRGWMNMEKGYLWPVRHIDSDACSRSSSWSLVGQRFEPSLSVVGLCLVLSSPPSRCKGMQKHVVPTNRWMESAFQSGAHWFMHGSCLLRKFCCIVVQQTSWHSACVVKLSLLWQNSHRHNLSVEHIHVLFWRKFLAASIIYYSTLIRPPPFLCGCVLIIWFYIQS